ncbi:MAG: hypothetical protein U0R24_09195 [Solirubrobacterales bacterium]
MSDAADLGPWLERPLSPVEPAVLASIEAGPIDPADALPRDDLDRLRDPAPLAVETGWCRLSDGVGYVAVRTAMPAVDAALVDWWFDWHPDDPARYRIWHPAAHVSNRVERPATGGAKAHWGTTHHPVEDVGLGVTDVRIEFRSPSELGFSDDALDDERVGTIVAGFAGEDGRRLRHTLMAHVFLRDGDGDGLVLRSRFWLGAAIRPYGPAPLAAPLGLLLNRSAIRRLAVPDVAPPALARHCAEEYANLAALLPELRRAGIAPAAASA